MENKTEQITFDGAHALALAMARSALRELSALSDSELLSARYLEAEGCWIFFTHDELEIPERIGGVGPSTVYAVSKTGMCAHVYDFRPDEEKMNDYLQMWSLHALGKRAEARAAWIAFSEKYDVGGSKV